MNLLYLYGYATFGAATAMFPAFVARCRWMQANRYRGLGLVWLVSFWGAGFLAWAATALLWPAFSAFRLWGALSKKLENAAQIAWDEDPEPELPDGSVFPAPSMQPLVEPADLRAKPEDIGDGSITTHCSMCDAQADSAAIFHLGVGSPIYTGLPDGWVAFPSLPVFCCLDCAKAWQENLHQTLTDMQEYDRDDCDRTDDRGG